MHAVEVARVAVQGLAGPVAHVVAADRGQAVAALDGEVAGRGAGLAARDERVVARVRVVLGEDVPVARVVGAPVADGDATARRRRVGPRVPADGAERARLPEPAVGPPPVLRVVAVLLPSVEGGPDGTALDVGDAGKVRLRGIVSLFTARCWFVT